ncbi:MAG: 2-C-methyl-D-erythritol 4-phosphate cytidylyltransferase [Candidatus Omnitrophica bacterium]|nr:2-C-methyl-D-erythritol 4-phosphate cytidylyltransferase [Candidatus Omnitrophota bacterium]
MAHEAVGVVVPAAGRGERLGGRTAKAFVPLAGRPLVCHTLAAFQRLPQVSSVVLVVRAGDRARMQQLVRRERFTKVRAIVAGGPSRAVSVARGVAALPAQARWVLVHDAARPCVTSRLITAVIQHAKRHGAVACGLRSPVTVKAVDEQDQVRLTLDREGLWLIQTPQAFRRDWFADALTRVNGTLEGFPDDVAVLEWAGFPVRMVPGDPLNIKVTTPEDLLLAEAILRNRHSA